MSIIRETTITCGRFVNDFKIVIDDENHQHYRINGSNNYINIDDQSNVLPRFKDCSINSIYCRVENNRQIARFKQIELKHDQIQDEFKIRSIQTHVMNSIVTITELMGVGFKMREVDGSKVISLIRAVLMLNNDSLNAKFNLTLNYFDELLIIKPFGKIAKQWLNVINWIINKPFNRSIDKFDLINEIVACEVIILYNLIINEINVIMEELNHEFNLKTAMKVFLEDLLHDIVNNNNSNHTLISRMKELDSLFDEISFIESKVGDSILVKDLKLVSINDSFETDLIKIDSCGISIKLNQQLQDNKRLIDDNQHETNLRTSSQDNNVGNSAIELVANNFFKSSFRATLSNDSVSPILNRLILQLGTLFSKMVKLNVINSNGKLKDISLFNLINARLLKDFIDNYHQIESSNSNREFDLLNELICGIGKIEINNCFIKLLQITLKCMVERKQEEELEQLINLELNSFLNMYRCDREQIEINSECAFTNVSNLINVDVKSDADPSIMREFNEFKTNMNSIANDMINHDSESKSGLLTLLKRLVNQHFELTVDGAIQVKPINYEFITILINDLCSIIDTTKCELSIKLTQLNSLFDKKFDCSVDVSSNKRMMDCCVLLSKLIKHYVNWLESLDILVEIELQFEDCEVNCNLNYARNLLNLNTFLEVNNESNNNIEIINKSTKVNMIYSTVVLKQMIMKVHSMCSKSKLTRIQGGFGRSQSNTFGQMMQTKMLIKRAKHEQDELLINLEKELNDIQCEIDKIIKINNDLSNSNDEDEELDCITDKLESDYLLNYRNLLLKQIDDIKLQLNQDESSKLNTKLNKNVIDLGIEIKFDYMNNNWNMIKQEFIDQIGFTVHYNLIKYQNNKIKVVLENGRELSQRYINYIKSEFKTQLKDFVGIEENCCWITKQFIEINSSTICINCNAHESFTDYVNVYSIRNGMMYFMKFDLNQRITVESTLIHKDESVFDKRIVKQLNKISSCCSLINDDIIVIHEETVKANANSLRKLEFQQNDYKNQLMIQLKTIETSSNASQLNGNYKVPLDLCPFVIDVNGKLNCKVLTSIKDGLPQYRNIGCLCEPFDSSVNKTVNVWIDVNTVDNKVKKLIKSYGWCPTISLERKLEKSIKRLNENLKTINALIRKTKQSSKRGKSWINQNWINAIDNGQTTGLNQNELLTRRKIIESQIEFYNELKEDLEGSHSTKWYKVQAVIPVNDHAEVGLKRMIKIVANKLNLNDTFIQEIIQKVKSMNEKMKAFNELKNEMKLFRDCLLLNKYAKYEMNKLKQYMIMRLNAITGEAIKMESKFDQLMEIVTNIITDIEFEESFDENGNDSQSMNDELQLKKTYCDISILEMNEQGKIANNGLKINYKNHCISMNIDDWIDSLPSLEQPIAVNNAFLSQLSFNKYAILINGVVLIGEVNSGPRELKDLNENINFEIPEISEIESKLNLLNLLCLIDCEFKMFKVPSIDCIKVTLRKISSGTTELNNLGTQFIKMINHDNLSLIGEFGIGLLNCELKSFNKSEYVDWKIDNQCFSVSDESNVIHELEFAPKINVKICNNPMEALHRITIEFIASILEYKGVKVRKEFTQNDSKERDLIVDDKHVIEIKTQTQFGRAMSMYHKKAKHLGEGIIIITVDSLYVDSFTLSLLTSIGFELNIWQYLTNVLCSFHQWRRNEAVILQTFFSSNAIKYDFNHLTIPVVRYQCENIEGYNLDTTPLMSIKFNEDVNDEYSISNVHINDLKKENGETLIELNKMFCKETQTDVRPMVKMKSKSINVKEQGQSMISSIKSFAETSKQADSVTINKGNETKQVVLNLNTKNMMVDKMIVDLMAIIDNIDLQQFDNERIISNVNLPRTGAVDLMECMNEISDLWTSKRICSHICKCCWFVIKSCYDPDYYSDQCKTKMKWIKRNKSTINRSNASLTIQQFTNEIKSHDVTLINYPSFKLLFLLMICNEIGIDESIFTLMKTMINSLPKSYNEIINTVIRFNSEMLLENSAINEIQEIEFIDSSIKRAVDLENFIDDISIAKLLEFKEERMNLVTANPNVNLIGNNQLIKEQLDDIEFNEFRFVKENDMNHSAFVALDDQFEMINDQLF